MSNRVAPHSQNVPGLRAGDAEREQTADKLRTAHAEGRIDTVELQDRIDRCYRAVTIHDLSQLIDDLPGPHQRRHPARPRAVLGHPVVLIAIAVLALCAVAIVNAAAHIDVFGAVLPLLIFARITLARHRRAGGF
jgi:hypothetical protein